MGSVSSTISERKKGRKGRRRKGKGRALGDLRPVTLTLRGFLNGGQQRSSLPVSSALRCQVGLLQVVIITHRPERQIWVHVLVSPRKWLTACFCSFATSWRPAFIHGQVRCLCVPFFTWLWGTVQYSHNPPLSGKDFCALFKDFI